MIFANVYKRDVIQEQADRAEFYHPTGNPVCANFRNWLRIPCAQLYQYLEYDRAAKSLNDNHFQIHQTTGITQ